MSHAAGNFVMDQIWAWREEGVGKLQFRLSLEFRRPGTPALSDERPPPRSVHLQVASPPPPRNGGASWEDGLELSDGTAFDAESWEPRRLAVSAVDGAKPLAEPPPDTLCFDEEIVVPAADGAGKGTIIALTVLGLNELAGDNHFLSVPYWREVDGERLDRVAVTYSVRRTLRLNGEIGKWIAISIDKFAPPKRKDADYIVVVGDEPPKQIFESSASSS